MLLARRPPRKLTHPQPSLNENIFPELFVFLYFLSFRFRVHRGDFWRCLGILPRPRELRICFHGPVDAGVCKENKFTLENVSHIFVVKYKGRFRQG